MSFMPMDDDNQRYADLAQLFMANNQQPDPSPVETANIGGMNLLVNRPQSIQQRIMPGLQNLAQSQINQNGMQKKGQFLQSVRQVTQTQGSPDDKINQLVSLMAQHGTDYGLGLKDIIDQYGKMKPAKYEPTTREEALEFERAKNTINYNGVGNAPGTSNPWGIPDINSNPDDYEAGYDSKGRIVPKLKQALSSAEEDNLTNAELMLKEIQNLKGYVAQDQGKSNPLEKTQMPIVSAFTEKGQEYRKIKEDLIDRIARLRTGAVIGVDEAKRFEKFLPQIFTRDSVDLKQLELFEQEMRSKINRLGYRKSGVGKISADMGGQPSNAGGGKDYSSLWN